VTTEPGSICASFRGAGWYQRGDSEPTNCIISTMDMACIYSLLVLEKEGGRTAFKQRISCWTNPTFDWWFGEWKSKFRCVVTWAPGCFFFRSPVRDLPSGSRCSKAECTGGQSLRLAGDFLYLAYSFDSITFVCHPLSGPLSKRSPQFRRKVLIRADPIRLCRPNTKNNARSSPIVLRLIPSYRAKSLWKPFLG